MPSSVLTVDGFAATVDVSGPEQGSVVVLLGAANQGPSAYEGVCQRLHTASLKTIVIAPDPRLSAKVVVSILDALGVRWALLVGDRVGGELAWELAATRLDRFIGYYEPYATSHDTLDADAAIQQEARNVARAVSHATAALRAGQLSRPDAGLRRPRPK